MLKRKELTVDRKKGEREGCKIGALVFIVVLFIGYVFGAFSFNLEGTDADKFVNKMCEMFTNPFILIIAIIALVVLVCALIIYVHEFSHLIVFKIGLPKEQRLGLRIKILHGFQPCVVWPNGKPKLGLKFLEQILPLITAGVIPCIIAIITKSNLLIVCAAWGASTSGEDVIAAWKLFKCRNLNVKYCEDCDEEHFGCYVYYEDEKDGK